MSTLEQIKKLREKTGAGVVDVKKAFEDAGGDEAKAVEFLRKRGQEKAGKKAGRSAGEGVVVSYIHSNRKVGAIVKLLCETDFVARNVEFQELAQDIAMHITAMNPKYLNPQDVPAEVLEKEKEIWMAQLAREGKPKNILAEIIKGKEKKLRDDLALLTQPFVKNPEVTVAELISEKIGKIGENIQVGGFYRMEL